MEGNAYAVPIQHALCEAVMLFSEDHLEAGEQCSHLLSEAEHGWLFIPQRQQIHDGSQCFIVNLDPPCSINPPPILQLGLVTDCSLPFVRSTGDVKQAA